MSEEDNEGRRISWRENSVFISAIRNISYFKQKVQSAFSSAA